jgi:hypothetical protein
MFSQTKILSIFWSYVIQLFAYHRWTLQMFMGFLSQPKTVMYDVTYLRTIKRWKYETVHITT